jgi:hypothetical protein
MRKALKGFITQFSKPNAGQPFRALCPGQYPSIGRE